MRSTPCGVSALEKRRARLGRSSGHAPAFASSVTSPSAEKNSGPMIVPSLQEDRKTGECRRYQIARSSRERTVAPARASLAHVIARLSAAVSLGVAAAPQCLCGLGTRIFLSDPRRRGVYPASLWTPRWVFSSTVVTSEGLSSCAGTRAYSHQSGTVQSVTGPGPLALKLISDERRLSSLRPPPCTEAMPSPPRNTRFAGRFACSS